MCDMKGMCQNDAVLAANRERARGSSNVLGGYLYEVKPPKVTLPPPRENSVAAALVRDR
jgi:hypothetical protein